MSINRYKFTDEAEALAKLFEAGYMVQDYVTNEEGEEVPDGAPHFPHGNKGNGFDVIVLGSISKPTGEVDEEGILLMETLDGWHVDVLAKGVPEVLESYAVEPKNPVHVV